MAVAVQSVGTATIGGSSGTSIVIPKPTGLVAGDLIIAFIGGPNDYNVNTASGYTGLTQGQSVEGNQMTMKAQWKIASAGDAAAADFTFTVSTGSGLTGFMLRIDGHDATTPINAESCTNLDTDGTDPSIANTITPSVADCLIILSIWEGDIQTNFSAWAIATSSPTFTEQTDASGTVAETGRGMCRGCATGVRPQTTATGNSTANLASSGNRFVGCQIAVAPASAVATAAGGTLAMMGV